MENTTKDNSVAATDSFPHNGALLTNYILKHNVNRADLARRLNITAPSVYNYAGSSSLQLYILWKASLALKHNFVAELGDLLPVKFETVCEKELREQVESLQKELEKLSLELSIYKTIVGK